MCSILGRRTLDYLAPLCPPFLCISKVLFFCLVVKISSGPLVIPLICTQHLHCNE